MEDNLIHYGVKGMRWGIRKAAKRVYNPASQMSNKELERKVRRLNLEKQYRNLHPSDLHLGQRFVDIFVAATIGQLATKAATAVVGAIVTTIVGGNR